MAALSEYLRDSLMELVFKEEAFSAPESVFISLHLSAGTDDSSAEWLATEVDSLNYDRVEMNPADWTAVSDGELSNDVAIIFPMAGEDWGEITHVGIWDDSDNLLFKGSMLTPRTVYNGDAPAFGAGNLTVSMS